MTDWIRVLLGQPLEEAREDSLEELNQAAETIWVPKRQAQRRAEALEEAGTSERTEAAQPMAAEAALMDEEERGERRFGSGAAGGGDGTKPADGPGTGMGRTAAADAGSDTLDTEKTAAEQGAEQLNGALRKGRFPAEMAGRGQTDEAAAAASTGGQAAFSSAGRQAARAEQGEARVWRQSGAEFLEAETASAQAEWAAAETARHSGGGSGYLAEALASPAPQTPAAGRLLAVMERNDRAAAYQTTARITEQAENNAWTGSEPARLDLFFERDARRYDNGFTMF